MKRSRLWQLDNSWRKVCERCWWWRWQHHRKCVFPLIYIFFWGYVYVKDQWNKKLLGSLYSIISFWCMFEFPDDNKQEILELKLFNIFRWGTHLYMSFFPSVGPSIHPSVLHHISGAIHHLIIIFGTYMSNDHISRGFVNFFKILIFWAVWG